MNPLVSVIVPVYGVENYIERCARSLFEQTLENMEFIFVDDCTKDNSINILLSVMNKYPKRKDQIKIIHHEVNKGLSFARKTGVIAANGEYIAHCDSDDWVDKIMYETMYQYAIKGNYDFVKCAHRKTDGKTDGEIKCVYTKDVQISKQDVISFLLQFKSWNSIWDTIVKRDLYNDICYTNDAMFEDFYVTSQLIMKANNFGVVNVPFYSYFINTNSICNQSGFQSTCKRVNQAKRNLDKVLLFLKENNSLVDKQKYVIVAKWNVKNIIIPFMSSSSYYELWNSLYPEIDDKIWYSTLLSLRNKIRFYCAHFHLIRFIKRK